MKSATGKNKGEEKVQYSLFFIQRFKGKVLFNVPMSDYTSLRIGGSADVMAFPQDEGEVLVVLGDQDPLSHGSTLLRAPRGRAGLSEARP